jgi:hypothetical protein
MAGFPTLPDPLSRLWTQIGIVWNPVWDWLDEEDLPREQVGVMGSLTAPREWD